MLWELFYGPFQGVWLPTPQFAYSKLHAYGVLILACELMADYLKRRKHWVKIGNLYDYADDKSLSFEASSFQTVLDNLQEDCKSTIQWFGDNVIENKPEKVSIYVLSPNQHEITHLKLCDELVYDFNNAARQ